MTKRLDLKSIKDFYQQATAQKHSLGTFSCAIYLIKKEFTGNSSCTLLQNAFCGILKVTRANYTQKAFSTDHIKI